MVQNKHNLYIYTICLALAGIAAACSDDSKNVESSLSCADGLAICGSACCADTCCDGVCVNTKNDKNNCGTCGNACLDGKVCMNNTCVANEEACNDGQEWCNGECVSIESDARHCGDCSTKCDKGESCQGGKCEAGCASGYTLIDDGKCVDTQRDSENCGHAGNVCGDNAYCADGSCACRNGYFDCDADMANGCESNVVCDYACEPGQQICPDTGACCDAGTSCCGSSCCAEGTACCGADLCLDLNSDPHHCGDCNIACNTNQVCESGKCVDSDIACPTEEGIIICWGACVQSFEDENNCGECGYACGEGQSCTMGKCTVACADGETACGDVCAKLNEDPMNCGACGTQCETTQVCTAIEEGYGCKEITEVNPEFICENTTDPEAGTEITMTQCWSECVDLQKDASHCGKCGNSCDDGSECVAGACTKTCESGLNACGETCHDFQNDALACGNCETQCATTQTCVEGVCTDTELNCNEGADPEDPAFVEKTLCWGTCADLKTDAANCGSCGKQCEESQVCTDGVCTDNGPVIVGCDESSKCYGVCKDLLNDDANCGACLNTCGKGEKCIQGKCELQCGALTVCGSACVDTTSSDTNCGACGVACKDGETCVGGACQCAEGRKNCDRNPENGCEAEADVECCIPYETRSCWRGLEENRGKGICKDGTQTCDESGQFWGPCINGTYPSAITCDDKGVYIGGDQNCNGIDDTTEACVSKCDLMAGEMSYIGCEYWPTYLRNHTKNSFYLVVSNPSETETANIIIRNMATANSETGKYSMTVGPGEVKRLALDIVEPSATNPISLSSYRVRSSIPVTAYQFNPMPVQQIATNDASLLMPINTFGKKYYVLTYTANTVPVLMDNNDKDNGYLDVVAAYPGTTTVKVIPNATLTNGHAKGTERTYTIQQYQVLNLEAETGDLTGSIVESDQPVALYGGTACSNIPEPQYTACDHLEEQIFPVQSWGNSYNAVKSHPRSTTGTAENELWRILASENDTEVTLGSPLNKTIKLNAGQFHEELTNASFTIDSNKPILVGSYLVGLNAVKLVDSSLTEINGGDPAFTLSVPHEQYRTDYDFLVPPSYTVNYITIIAPLDTVIQMDNATLDLSSFKTIGDGSRFIYGYISLGSKEQAHHISASKPIGLAGYGFASYVSYGYPIGLDLKVINTN